MPESLRLVQAYASTDDQGLSVAHGHGVIDHYCLYDGARES